jgi:hypothetical protein
MALTPVPAEMPPTTNQIHADIWAMMVIHTIRRTIRMTDLRPFGVKDEGSRVRDDAEGVARARIQGDLFGFRV